MVLSLSVVALWMFKDKQHGRLRAGPALWGVTLPSLPDSPDWCEGQWDETTMDFKMNT
jgi:hypothetical protein